MCLERDNDHIIIIMMSKIKGSFILPLEAEGSTLPGRRKPHQ